ncbi:MAG: PAS domain S-box protein [Elusimicrobia bacterium]|nr:PAS domain S-box protein [Elusimicrobiota bacterium]
MIPLFQNFILFLVYCLFAYWSANFAIADPHISAAALSTGVAVGALIIWGLRLWPAVFLGALLSNLLLGTSWLVSLGIATLNAAEAMITAGLTLRYVGGVRAFYTAQGCLGFFAAMSLSAGFNGLGMVYLLSLEGPLSGGKGLLFATTWLGNTAVGLALVPFLALWRAHPWPGFSGRQWLELAALGLLLAVTAQLIFGRLIPLPVQQYPLTFAAMPVLVWAAARFSQRESATAMAALSAMAVVGTLQGFGPFATLPPQEGFLMLQSFMAVMALATLCLGGSISQAREAVRAARAAQGELRQITDALPVLVCYVDSEERYIFNNRAYENWFRRPLEDFQGKHIKEVVDEEAYRRLHPAIEKALSGERSSVEAKVNYPAGERWVRAECIPARHNGTDGVIALVSDISECKKAEETLRRSHEDLERKVAARTLDLTRLNEELRKEIAQRKRAEQELRVFAQAVDHVPIGLTVFKLEEENDPGSFRAVMVNPAVRQQVGVSPEELRGRRLDEIASGLFKTAIPGELLEVLKQGRPRDFGVIHYKDDRLGENYFNIKAFPLPEGRIGVAYENVSSRMRMETALRQSEERFRMIFDQGPLGMAIIERDFRLLMVNKALCRMLGYEPDELIGRDIGMIIHAEQRHEDRTLTEQLFKKGRGASFQNEATHVRKDGSLLWGRQNVASFGGG